MYCRKCGKEITENESRRYDKFCKNCYEDNVSANPKNYRQYKCKKCGNTYGKETKICPNCKYPIEKMRTRKILIIYGILATVFLLICLSISSIMSYSVERKEMKKIASLIENDYDFDSAYKKVSQLSEKQQKKGYKQILSSIDKKIEKIKQGTEDKRLVKMFDSISPSQLKVANFSEEIEKRENITDVYTLYIQAQKDIEKNDYIAIYTKMWTIRNNTYFSNMDEKFRSQVDQKYDEIKEKAERELLTKTQELKESGDYISIKRLIEPAFSQSKNEEIQKMHEIAKVEAEAQKKREEEQKEAERKKAEEERENERINKYKSAIRVSRVRTSRPNSAGGVDLYISWKNLSDKVIKYAYFTVVPYNAVDDIMTCDIRRYSDFTGQETGPFYKGQGNTGSTYWENAWYNYTITKAILKKVEIKYMDGTSLEIPTSYIDYIQ